MLNEWTTQQESFFDGLSTEYGSYDFSKESNASKRSSKKFIDFMELENKNASIIEVGCGRGEWVIKLALLGFNVTGVDISQKSLDKLAELGNKLGVTDKIKLVRADAQESLADVLGIERYDRVFCYNLLHHVSDIEKTVRSMISVAKPGAKVVAYEPCPFHFWWYICPFFDKKFIWKIEKGLLNTNPLYIEKVFESGGLRNITYMPWDYFPFISPDRVLRVTEKVQSLLSKLPILRYFPSVYVIKGDVA